MQLHKSLLSLISHIKSAFISQEPTPQFFYTHLSTYNSTLSNFNIFLKNDINQLTYFYQTNLNSFSNSTSSLYYKLKLFQTQNFILQNKLLHKEALITNLTKSILSLKSSYIENQKCRYKIYTNQIEEIHLMILEKDLEKIGDMLNEVKEIVLNMERQKKEVEDLNKEIKRIRKKIGYDYDNNISKMDVVLTEKSLLDNSSMLICKLHNKLK